MSRVGQGFQEDAGGVRDLSDNIFSLGRVDGVAGINWHITSGHAVM